MFKKIHRNYRRIIACLLTAVMIVTNVGMNLNVAFAASVEETALFLIDAADLQEAILEAVENGEVFDFSSLELTAKASSEKTSYEKLLGRKSGDAYQLDVDIDDSYAPAGTAVEVFYNAGTDDVIFLFINESEMIVNFRANVGGYETAGVTINPNTANVPDPDVSWAEDYSDTTMIQDETKKLGAVVIDQTVEAEIETEDNIENETEDQIREETGDDVEVEAEENEAEIEKEIKTERVDEVEQADEESAIEAEETETVAAASISLHKVQRVAATASEEENEAETEEELENEAEEISDREDEAEIVTEVETETTEVETTEAEIIETETSEAVEDTVTMEEVIIEESDIEEPAIEESGTSANDKSTVKFDDEQMLEDDSIEILGELEGKTFQTVTIWNSANARAYRVAAEKVAEMYAYNQIEWQSYNTDATVLDLEEETEEVVAGYTITLDYTVEPSTAEVTWSSSNPSVATVSDNGVVTGVAAGQATITAASGDLSDSVEVTVLAKPSGMYCNIVPTLNNAEVAYIHFYDAEGAKNNKMTTVNANSVINSFVTSSQNGYVVFFVKPADGYLLTGLGSNGNGDLYSLNAASFGNIAAYPGLSDAVSRAKEAGYVACFGYSRNKGTTTAFNAEFEVNGVQPGMTVSAVCDKTEDVVPGDELTFTVTITPQTVVNGFTLNVDSVDVTSLTINGRSYTVDNLTANADGTYTGAIVHTATAAECNSGKVKMDVQGSITYKYQLGVKDSTGITSSATTTAVTTATADATAAIAPKAGVSYSYVYINADDTAASNYPDAIKNAPTDDNQYYVNAAVTLEQVTATEIPDDKNGGYWTYEGWYQNDDLVTTETVNMPQNMVLALEGRWTFHAYPTEEENTAPSEEETTAPTEEENTAPTVTPSGNGGDGGGSNSGGSSSSSGSSGSSGSSRRSSSSGSSTSVTIDPETVPLSAMPNGDGEGSQILTIIEDEEVPLGALPKTGHNRSAAWMFALSSMMLTAFAIVTRKKDGEEQE